MFVNLIDGVFCLWIVYTAEKSKKEKILRVNKLNQKKKKMNVWAPSSCGESIKELS